jgi:hypothetical protein
MPKSFELPDSSATSQKNRPQRVGSAEGAIHLRQTIGLHGLFNPASFNAQLTDRGPTEASEASADAPGGGSGERRVGPAP